MQSRHQFRLVHWRKQDQSRQLCRSFRCWLQHNMDAYNDYTSNYNKCNSCWAGGSGINRACGEKRAGKCGSRFKKWNDWTVGGHGISLSRLSGQWAHAWREKKSHQSTDAEALKIRWLVGCLWSWSGRFYELCSILRVGLWVHIVVFKGHRPWWWHAGRCHSRLIFWHLLHVRRLLRTSHTPLQVSSVYHLNL